MPPLTLSYHKKTQCYVLRGFSRPWKKRCDMFSEGNVAQCPSSRVGSPLADNNGSLAHFFKNLNLFCWMWQPAANCHGCLACFKFFLKPIKLPLLFAVGCQSHPTRFLSRIVCRGQEGPKGRKGGTLRPDFQANTKSRIFLKLISPQDTRRRL